MSVALHALEFVVEFADRDRNRDRLRYPEAMEVSIGKGNVTSSAETKVDGIENCGLPRIPEPIMQLIPGLGCQTNFLRQRKLRMSI
jgi:hypothetical protein